jgi:uncharacterized protein (TIGR00730 family)
MKICITLTSSLHVGQEYIDITHVVVKSIAEKGYSIVYGGTSYGMMLELAETYKKSSKKELIGVMAKDLIAVTKGYTVYEKLDEQHLVDTIGERIAKITQLADSFLILPGGYGTVEEMVVMVGGKVNKLYDKPIAMYNYNGFYDTTISFFNELQQKKFTKIKFEDVVFVSKNIDDILNYFANYQSVQIVDKFF